MTDVARATITHIAYDGEALRTGSMDVRDLAPALLAVGDLLQHANRNHDRAQLLVKVRSDVVEVIEVIPPLRQVPLIAPSELPPIKGKKTRKKKSS